MPRDESADRSAHQFARFLARCFSVRMDHDGNPAGMKMSLKRKGPEGRKVRLLIEHAHEDIGQVFVEWENEAVMRQTIRAAADLLGEPNRVPDDGGDP